MSIDEKSLQLELVRKVRLQRGVHDILEEKTKLFITVQRVINVVFSSFITLIVFADFGLLTQIAPEYSGFKAMLTIGVLSFLLFITNSLADVFEISGRNAKHFQAIQQYTDLLSDIKKTKYSSANYEIPTAMLQNYNERYLQLSNSTSTTSGRAFDKAQAKYLIRRSLRHAIKQDPFASRRKLKSLAKKHLDECSSDEGII